MNEKKKKILKKMERKIKLGIHKNEKMKKEKK